MKFLKCQLLRTVPLPSFVLSCSVFSVSITMFSVYGCAVPMFSLYGCAVHGDGCSSVWAGSWTVFGDVPYCRPLTFFLVNLTCSLWLFLLMTITLFLGSSISPSPLQIIIRWQINTRVLLWQINIYVLLWQINTHVLLQLANKYICVTMTNKYTCVTSIGK